MRIEGYAKGDFSAYFYGEMLFISISKKANKYLPNGDREFFYILNIYQKMAWNVEDETDLMQIYWPGMLRMKQTKHKYIYRPWILKTKTVSGGAFRPTEASVIRIVDG